MKKWWNSLRVDSKRCRDEPQENTTCIQFYPSSKLHKFTTLWTIVYYLAARRQWVNSNNSKYNNILILGILSMCSTNQAAVSPFGVRLNNHLHKDGLKKHSGPCRWLHIAFYSYIITVIATDGEELLYICTYTVPSCSNKIKLFMYRYIVES